MKILIVESNNDQLLWLKRKLTDAEHEVRGVHNGNWGLKMWKGFHPFDLVITNYCFPGKVIPDGLALIRAIRLLGPQQHFILQTSETNLLVPHGVKLIHKPYPFQRLLRLMKVPGEPLLPFNPAESR